MANLEDKSVEHRGTPRSHAVTTASGVASFGALVRRHRQAADLTQRELAQRAGLSLRALSALEADHRRTPRTQTIARLAHALALAPAERAALEAAGRPHPMAHVANERPLLLLSSPPPPSDNLPLPPTPLLGRERELAEVTALLRDTTVRLVTLTGPGGVGKTRLSIEAARMLLDAGEGFPGGVWFVPLAALHDPALVIPHIAQTLGLSERGGVRIADALHGFLRDKALLVLLDNFEHVGTAASQVAELLEWSAGLKLLVSSRASLRVRAEHGFPVPLLPGPPMAPGHPATAAQIEHYAATKLFLQRSRAAHPSFAITDATAPAVAAICGQLDGLPLAIELVAARVRLLPPAALLARLERQEPVLTDGPLDLPERQRTVRATIAWSEDLLAPEERRLFHRLAVFAGGWTLDAAEAICAAPEQVAPPQGQVLDALGTLVDHSLVQRRDEAAEPHFAMLHVIREYALEQLRTNGEMEALRRAHAHYFCDFAERIEPATRESGIQAWLVAIEKELDNLRAALGWARATGEAELGLRLATALWLFWLEGGHLSEGQQWFEALLALADTASASLPAWLRARALADVGMLLATQRRLDEAVTYLKAGIALGRAADDWLALIIGLQFWGAVLRVTGRLEQAAACYEQVLTIGRARGEALAIYTPLASMAEIAYSREDWAEATAHFTEAMAVSRAAGHVAHVSLMLLRLSMVALRQHDAQHAAALLREAIGIAQGEWSAWALLNLLELLATAEANLGQNERAARLFGAVATRRATAVAPYMPTEQPDIEAMVAPMRTALSAGPWAAAFAAGRVLALEEAIAEALAAPAPPGAEPASEAPAQAVNGAPSHPPHGPRTSFAGLTVREREVLRLLAQGLSDAQIAAHLVISPRTVNHHTAAIYGKLGVTSRAAAAHYALEHHLL